MNIHDIQGEITRLEKEKFYLGMKDHWSADDYAYDRKLATQIAHLKQMIGGESNGIDQM